MVWQGVLLEESLEDKSILKTVNIIETTTGELETEDRVMTFHKIEVEDSKKVEFIDEVMHCIKSAFYVHICKDGEMYVMFKGVVFNFTKNDPNLKKAREYGISVGIIKEQLEFEYLIDHSLD